MFTIAYNIHACSLFHPLCPPPINCIPGSRPRVPSSPNRSASLSDFSTLSPSHISDTCRQHAASKVPHDCRKEQKRSMSHVTRHAGGKKPNARAVSHLHLSTFHQVRAATTALMEEPLLMRCQHVFIVYRRGSPSHPRSKQSVYDLSFFCSRHSFVRKQDRWTLVFSQRFALRFEQEKTEDIISVMVSLPR